MKKEVVASDDFGRALFSRKREKEKAKESAKNEKDGTMIIGRRQHIRVLLLFICFILFSPPLYNVSDKGQLGLKSKHGEEPATMERKGSE